VSDAPSPCIFFVALFWTYSSKSVSCTGKHSTGLSPPAASHKGRREGRDHLPPRCSASRSPRGRWPALLQGHVSASWFTCPPGPPGPSLGSCFPACAGTGVIPAQARDVAFPFVELHEVPGGPLPSLSRSLGVAVPPVCLPAAPPRFVSLADMLTVHCDTSCRAN